MRKITHIVVHHTASPGPVTTVKAVDNFHKTKNWGTKDKPAYCKISSLGYYVQYHYFIDWQGVVTQCHDDQDISWHGNSANPFSLGVCLAGWFDQGHDAGPTQAQVTALTKLVRTLAEKYSITSDHILPHRIYNTTKSCYGALLTTTWAAGLLGGRKELKAPYFERKIGQPGIAYYDPSTDSLVAITDGSIVKNMLGAYPPNEVVEWSRPLSEKQLGFITK